MTTAPMACTTDDGAPDNDVGRLFDVHSERVFAYCLRRLRCRSEAEDAVQTTFLHALQARRRGVVPDCEIAWLLGIAKNVCRSHFRSASRRGSVANVDVEEVGTRPRDGDTELLIGLQGALDTMPQRQRDAIVLREWRGLPPREIATHLGMSVPATHALLTRARDSLASALVVARRPALGLAWLVYELRSHVKALLGTASSKTAAAAAVVMVGTGAGVGGIAIQQGIASDSEPSRVEEVGGKRSVSARSSSGGSPVVRPTARPSSRPRVGTRSGARPTVRAQTSGSIAVPSPIATAPPATGATPTSDGVALDAAETIPASTSVVPELPAPPALDPVLPVLPQPVEELPPLAVPTLETPDVDVPGVEIPTVELPTVDVGQQPAPNVPPLTLP